jgi:hypothetical protein
MRFRGGCAVALAVAGASLLAAPPDVPQTPDLAALMERAGVSVARFVEAFSNVVATEHYSQEIETEARVGSTTGSASIARTRRDLTSEFLLIRIGGPLEWRPFRDVFEVDGRAVRERRDRLVTLFQTSSGNGYEQAARIAQESARYNIGLAGRTVNTPVLPLLFLQSAIQPRFRVTIEGRDGDAGGNTWRVTYRESVAPTIIRGITTTDDRDLPASGRFWIDADTGRIGKTELVLATSAMVARLVTTYRDDERLGIPVPVEMREEYTIADDARTRQRARKVTGFARYDGFRRFEVSTESSLTARAPQTPLVASVVRRAGEYVTRFAQAFSNVVTEEHYVQNVSAGVPSGMLRSGGQRDLRSDLLLIRVGGIAEWQPFRDVFEVGGAPVRDRDERLAKLFNQPTSALLARAEAIAVESSRYNIGSVMRTVNTPVHTLLFLRPSLQPRFEFTLDKQDESAGPDVWIVKYEEHARPTLIRGDRDSDLPASGRFWIEAGNGRVLRSELATFSGAGTARVTTRFRVDPETQIAVPAEMHEEYQLQRGRVTATATYGHFRRFNVSTDTKIAPSTP